MSKKSLSHLLEPSFRLYFLFLAAFVVAAVGAGEYLLAGIEGVIVLVLFLYFRRRTAEDRKEVLSYLENITDRSGQGHHGQRPPAHGDLPPRE